MRKEKAKLLADGIIYFKHPIESKKTLGPNKHSKNAVYKKGIKNMYIQH